MKSLRGAFKLPQMRARPWRGAAALVAVLLGILLPASAASAETQVNPVFVAPSASTLTVGQTVPMRLEVRNSSTGQEATGVVRVADIRVNPACDDASLPSCTNANAGAITLSATGTGVAGSACAGMTFTNSGPNGSGFYAFNWTGNIDLLVNEECRIDFTLDVARVPTVDSSPNPGIQTFRTASSTGLHQPDLAVGTGTSSSLVTVNRAATSLSAAATDATIGSPICEHGHAVGRRRPRGGPSRSTPTRRATRPAPACPSSPRRSR